jgi:hypothetical protein
MNVDGGGIIEMFVVSAGSVRATAQIDLGACKSIVLCASARSGAKSNVGIATDTSSVVR